MIYKLKISDLYEELTDFLKAANPDASALDDISKKAIVYGGKLIGAANTQEAPFDPSAFNERKLSKHFNTASQALRRIIRTPEHTQQPSEFLVLAKLEQRRGNDQEAYDILSEGIDKWPEDPKLHVRRLWSAPYLGIDTTDLIAQIDESIMEDFATALANSVQFALPHLKDASEGQSQQARQAMLNTLKHVAMLYPNEEILKQIIEYSLVEADLSEGDTAKQHHAFADHIRNALTAVADVAPEPPKFEG